MKTKGILSELSLKIMIIVLIIIILILAAWIIFKRDNDKEYKILLNGEKYITLNQGDKYIEPGYIAYINDELATDKVIITNEVTENVPGIYRILYKIDDYYEYRYIEIKETIDYKLEIILEENILELTNQDVIVNVKVTGDTFYLLTLPDGNIINTNTASFVVKENGVYKFEARNINNELFTEEITISNIDKTSPVGSCTATLLKNSTSINVKTDENNIIYHYYDNGKLLTMNNINNYIVNNKTSEIIKVVLEDRASNKSEIKCSITDKRYYDPVVPNSGEKIVYRGNSETLKTYIVDRKTYYMTYIWVKDAYTQLNKSASPEYGSKLYLPKDLINKAVSDNNLNNKIIVGFNASGFYLKDQFDAISVEVYPKYDKTSVGTLVINNGVVARNAYNYAIKTWYTIGVNKDNKLLVFEDSKDNNANNKYAWSQQVISSGIRNTFTFAAPLIQNGVKSNITTSMPGGFTDRKGLQIICQINENNFLLFSSRDETRNRALDEFMKLGCKTAMNLDGGGSVSLLYKDKNSNEIVKVTGGNRALPEVGYFTE